MLFCDNTINPDKLQLLKDYAQTGDLILFSGRNTNSAFISFFTESIWTHVGIIFRMKKRLINRIHLSKFPNNSPLFRNDKELDEEMLLFWESVRSTTPSWDAITGYPNGDGVRLIPVELKLENYKGRYISWRQISYCPWLENQEEHDQLLSEIILRHHGKPYEDNRIELITAAFPTLTTALSNRQPTTDKFFCSELTAQTYMEMKLINEIRPSNLYAPCIFSSFYQKIPFNSHATAPFFLYKEISLTRNFFNPSLVTEIYRKQIYYCGKKTKKVIIKEEEEFIPINIDSTFDFLVNTIVKSTDNDKNQTISEI